MKEKKIAIVGHGISTMASMVKSIVSDKMDVVMIEKPTEILEYKNPYDFEMPFKAPLTRAERRKLARKKKIN